MEVGDRLAFDGGSVSDHDIAEVEMHDIDCKMKPHDLLRKTRPAFAVINEYLQRDWRHSRTMLPPDGLERVTIRKRDSASSTRRFSAGEVP
jgi:hypothetical protein